MVTQETTHRTPSSSHNPLAWLLRSLSRDLKSAYRPELHYMRGPGPKWHEKNTLPQQSEIADLHATKPAA
jgi:hypothetical protein